MNANQALKPTGQKAGRRLIESCINNATLSAKKGAGPIA